MHCLYNLYFIILHVLAIIIGYWLDNTFTLNYFYFIIFNIFLRKNLKEETILFYFRKQPIYYTDDFMGSRV